jgi:hypothetical protein
MVKDEVWKVQHFPRETTVYTIIVLLRPEAAHTNLNGSIRYAPRPGRGSIDFGVRRVTTRLIPVQHRRS